MNILCAAAVLTGVTRRPRVCRLITPCTLAERMAPSDAALAKGEESGGGGGLLTPIYSSDCAGANSVRP